MMRIDISPEAYNDLDGIKENLDTRFGKKSKKKL